MCFMGDFPGDPVVKNPSSSTGGVSSIPGQGTKFPHATGHTSHNSWAYELESPHLTAEENARVLP